MDDESKTLLGVLRHNARKSLAEVSRATDIPQSTLFDRLRRLEQGIIIKYTSLYSMEDLHFLRIFLQVIPKAGKVNDVQKLLIDNRQVNSLQRCSHTFLVDVYVAKLPELEEIEELLKPLARIKTFLVTKTLVAEQFFPDVN